MRRRVALAGSVLLVLAGCGDGAPGPSSATSVARSSGASPAASPAAGQISFGAATTIASGLSVPWGLAFLPDGDALVSERDSGRVLRVPAAGGEPVELGTVPGVRHDGEGGLLGLAVAPTYGQDGYVYAYLTSRDDNRVVRFTVGAVRTPEVVLDGISRASIHNGGRIGFGPDGRLYIGTGDAGEKGAAQDREDLNGKILRIEADGSVPADNPFPGSPVWSYGHRNVQGFAWDAQGRMFADEFGQNTVDEVNRIEPGKNYGWPVVEGSGDTAAGRYTNPLVTWSTSEASPSGAAIVGDTLYVAALRGRRVWAVPLDGSGGTGTPVPELQGTLGRVRTVAAAADGSLWVATSNTDGRGDPGRDDDRILRFAPA